MRFTENGFKIFSGSASKDMSLEIANVLEVPVGQMEVAKFSDGEIKVSLAETVRGVDVFLVQSTCFPVNDNLMELLIMIDACRRASAGRITAVMPYFGYARQDRKAKPRDPISAKLIADVLTSAGANRVLTMDLHALQIQGFFNIPVDHLIGAPMFFKYFSEKFNGKKEDLVIVSPDVGSVTRTRVFAAKMDVLMAIVDKRRPKANMCEVLNIIGNVQDKSVIILDDMIDTAGTLCNAVSALKKIGGAKDVYACATHGILSGDAIEIIKESPMKELVLLDTIPLVKEKKIDKIKVLSTAALFADVIRRLHWEEPVSSDY
ncbi:MAG: ribose-phosphate pyrophosphokinase [Oscillospiraceae bacterium]|nr:ribose-phosphate pyrophosphokinase [Oscillospiraceae bacterium]